MTTAEYLQLSHKSLQEAETLLAQGDYHQTSEKFWGAAATMVKAIAERRGWPHASHRDLNRTVSRVAQESDRGELLRLFGLANALHQNFYEDWLTPDQVASFAGAVRELLDQLGSMVAA